MRTRGDKLRWWEWPLVLLPAVLLVVLGIGAMLALWIGAIRLVGSLDFGMQLLLFAALFAVGASVTFVRFIAALLAWMGYHWRGGG